MSWAAMQNVAMIRRSLSGNYQLVIPLGYNMDGSERSVETESCSSCSTLNPKVI